MEAISFILGCVSVLMVIILEVIITPIIDKMADELRKQRKRHDRLRG